MSALVGGLDETGWGSLAGPLLSTVAVFDAAGLAALPATVRDSKKMSPEQRRRAVPEILRLAVAIGNGIVMPEEIDRLRPRYALQESYRRALADCDTRPDLLVVDGSNRVESWPGRQTVEPRADSSHRQVSAASVLAKVVRDEWMSGIGFRFPEYGWEGNKGYGTPDHLEAIRLHGLLFGQDGWPYVHRRSYCGGKGFVVRGLVPVVR